LETSEQGAVLEEEVTVGEIEQGKGGLASRRRIS